MARYRAADGNTEGGPPPAALEGIRRRLDDPAAAARLDPYGMLHLIEGLPDQVLPGYEIGRQVALKVPPGGFTAVVVAGMGGSAIGGDLLKAVAAEQAAVPVEVVRDYRLPAYVGPRTLVLASSYSGSTEETLAAQEQAARAGATVVALTSGGVLAQRAADHRWPVARLPSGIPPRAALGYSLFAGLGILHGAGLLPDLQETARVCVGALQAVRQRAGMHQGWRSNPAKQEALRLIDCVPVVYGGCGLGASVAYRWKCQFNENGKHPAYWVGLPELNHNEVVGWEAPPAAARHLRVLFLRLGDESARMAARFDITQRMVEGRAGSWSEWVAEGENHLARALGLLYWGDYVSFYLAIAKGVDPTPVRFIDRLKAELASVRG